MGTLFTIIVIIAVIMHLALDAAKMEKIKKMSYEKQLEAFTEMGWIVTTEGPSGAQLRKPVGGGSKLAVAIGILTCWIPFICFVGIFFLIIGLMGVVTAGEKRFLAKNS